MRTLLAVGSLVLVAAIAWWWTSRDAGAPPPPPGNAPEHVDTARDPGAPLPDSSGVREDASPQPAAEPPTDEPVAPADEAPPPDAPSAAATQPTFVSVTSRLNSHEVPSFRWRFTHPGGQVRGEAQESRVELPLPNGALGDLLVEADGMQPELRRDVAIPRADERQLRLRIELTPAPRGEGITLLVRDPNGGAVPGVRVRAVELTAQNRGGAWHLDPPLWSRRAMAADGMFILPALPPGEYGIQLVADWPDGRSRPWSVFRRTFTLTGSNGFLEHVALEPACALQLDLVRPDGAPFVPGPGGDVRVTLEKVGEVGIRRRWMCTNPDGKGFLVEVDRVPGPSPVWLGAPVPPGTYTLSLFVGDELRVSRPLALGATEQTERVVVH